MISTVPVCCPYCGAVVEHTVDLMGGAVQRYVEDCEVCCRPWAVEVRLVNEEPDSTRVMVTTLDE
jgi:transposase-like protein